MLPEESEEPDAPMDGLKSTRIKDAGIAIRHSGGRILSYTAGSRNGLERVDGKGPHLKKKLNFQAVIKSAASAASPKTKI